MFYGIRNFSAVFRTFWYLTHPEPVQWSPHIHVWYYLYIYTFPLWNVSCCWCLLLTEKVRL